MSVLYFCNRHLTQVSGTEIAPRIQFSGDWSNLVQQYSYHPLPTVAQGTMPPTAPPSLPNYLADGLPKQDDEALRDAREYIDELLAAREQRRQEPVTEDDLPENAHLLENESSSAVYLEYRTCGDTTCSCMSGGEKHGPYKAPMPV